MIFAVREKIGKKLVIQFVLLALFVLLTAANLFLSAVSGKSTPSIIIGVNSALIAITVMQVLRLSRTPYRIDVEEDAVSLYGYFSNRRIPYAEISRLETKEFKGLGSVPLQAVCLYNQNNRPVANLPDQYFDFQRLAPEIQAHLRPAETMATTALESASGCFPVRLDTDSAIPEAPPAREFPPGLKVMLWVTLAYALTGILMNTLRLLLVTVALLGGGGTEPDIGASPERQMLAAALLTVLAAMFFGIMLFIGMIGALCRRRWGWQLGCPAAILMVLAALGLLALDYISFHLSGGEVNGLTGAPARGALVLSTLATIIWNSIPVIQFCLFCRKTVRSVFR